MKTTRMSNQITSKAFHLANSLLLLSLTACSGFSGLSGGSKSLSSEILRSGGQTPLKIMPLGDSITWGYSGQDPMASQGGYRTQLASLLEASNLPFTFVGSQSSGPDSLDQKSNEGHPGYRIDEIAANVDAWIATYRPDDILLHIGTNDFVQGKEQDAQYRLSLLIDQITADAPQATLFVASIIPLNLAGSYNANIDYYNANLQQIVATKASVEGKKVVFVDMHSAVSSYAFSPDYDSDGIHPSPVGYRKMANRWASALSVALPSASSGAVTAAAKRVVIQRFSDANGFHSFARADKLDSVSADLQNEGAAFTLFSAEYNSTIPIYECLTGARQFLSIDSTCEGQTVVSRLGFVRSVQTGSNTPLYRLRSNEGDYIESKDTSAVSAGYILEGPLGFVL